MLQKTLKYSFCLLLLLLAIETTIGQVVFSENEITPASAAKEEVQRYFGYEDLFFRYLTIPYDLNNNINQQGKFVDLGYPLLALLPLLFLVFFYKNKKIFYGAIVLFTCYLFSCFQYSYLLDSKNLKYNPGVIEGATSTEFPRSEAVLLEPLYAMASVFSAPLTKTFGLLSGSSDYITYPILALMTLLVMFFILNTKRLNRLTQILLLISLTFSFAWWILSSGIIWYGFLLIPVCFIFILKGTKKKDAPEAVNHSLYQKVAYSVCLSWMVLVGISRISNISNILPIGHSDSGKAIVDPRLMPYAVGMINAEKSIELSAKNVTKGLRRINSNDELILATGTSLSFDVRNNSKRIFEDNSLSFVYGIINRERTKGATTKTIKEYGFKYILLDLMTPSIDRTPERSLTKKFQAVLTLLYQNPQIRLLATDRIVSKTDQSGKKVYAEDVFGTEFREIGSYAIFELVD